MKTQSVFQKTFFLSLMLLLSLSACKVSKSSTDDTGDDTGDDTTTDTTDNDTGATVPDPIDGFSLVITQNDNYSVLVSKDGDGSTECKADEGDRISCIVDMNEHDLYINGLKLGWAAPQDQCDYIGQYHYYYAAYPIGIMPSATFYYAVDDVLQDIESYDPGAGLSITTPWNTMEANSACGTDIVYWMDKNGDGSMDAGEFYCHAELFGSPASESGSLKCPWDYSTIEGGSSCCYGSYTEYSFDGTDPAVDDGASWGSKSNYANCFRGPGLSDFSAPKNAFGIPYYITTLVETEGLQDSIAISSPYSTGHKNQIYAANYFNKTSDHSGAGEAATLSSFHGLYFVPGDNTVQAPINMAIGFPYYQIDCLDHDFELKAQIRVMVREWNTLSAFEDFVDGTSSNADTNSTDDPYDNGVDEYLDDYQDWKDLQANSTVSFDQSLYSTDSGFRAYYELSGSLDTDLLWNDSDFYMGFPAQ